MIILGYLAGIATALIVIILFIGGSIVYIARTQAKITAKICDAFTPANEPERKNKSKH